MPSETEGVTEKEGRGREWRELGSRRKECRCDESVCSALLVISHFFVFVAP